MLVINERMADDDTDDFETFADANPDLFEWPSPLLTKHYRGATLESERARRTFVFPDLSR